MIKQLVNQSGLKKKYIAGKLKISESYLSLMLSNDRPMPELIEKEIKRLCNLQIKA